MSDRNRWSSTSSWWKAFAVLFVLAACSAACGGSSRSPDGIGTGSDGGGAGSDAGTVTDGGSQPLDEAVRLATATAANAVYQANLARPKAERDAALVSFLREQATIEAAGVSSADNVWARFTDGTLYMVLDNGGPPPPLAPSPAAALVEAARSPFLSDLPGGVRAIIGNSLGPPWRDVSGEIGGWLADAGYAVQSAGFTVDDFENMSDVSVLFWQTHSGEGQLRPDAGTPQPGGGPPVVFSFWTNTASSGNPPQKMKALRDDGSLALAFVDGVFRYAITDKYIRERLKGKFAPAALVAIDSCTGAGADAAWAAAGVSHFVSWSALSGNISYLAFEKYFDRLLGANAATPLSTPKERSFPTGAVEAWMQRDGYDLDPSIFDTGEKSVAQLRFLHHPANGDFAILRPTIYRALNTAPGAGQTFFRFTLDGSFGDDPGPARRSVSLGATQLDVLSWNPTQVILKVPSPIPSGKFQVSIGPRKSEAVPLTEWLIPFTYDFVGLDTLQYQITMNCRLRADVRGARALPVDALAWPPTATWELEDSGGSVSVSGDLSDTSGKLLEHWTGGGSLRWYDPAVKPLTNFVMCSGGFDQPSSTVFLGLAAAGNFSKAPASGTGTASLDGIIPPTVLTVDWQTMTINGNTITVTPATNHGVSASLSWPSVTPTNMPVDDDPR